MLKTRDIITSLLLAAAICFVTMLGAQKIAQSPIYRQSRIVSMLVNQDSIGVSSILKDTRNIDMVIKFAGALTSAYINFELIPVNETSSFVAVFESLPENAEIESFAYRRKDLLIMGTADTVGTYESFLAAIRERKHFASVSGQSYVSTDGGIRFEIICSTSASEAYFNFALTHSKPPYLYSLL